MNASLAPLPFCFDDMFILHQYGGLTRYELVKTKDVPVFREYFARQLISRCLLISACLSTAHTATATQQFTSNVAQPMVIELYTSQGCSSCPAAENWLSQLKSHPDLFKTLFPLAFHVDYWDYLGWQDSFASSAASQRQYQYRRLGLSRSVYTPGLIINGKESRNWRRPAPPEDTSDPDTLNLVVNQNDVVLQYSTPLPNLTAHLAILKMDAKLPISSGENAGRMINHDFVVHQWQILTSPTSKPKWHFKSPQLEVKKGQAIVAWLSQNNNPKPIRVVGGWLH